MKKPDTLCTVDNKLVLYNHCGKQYSNSKKKIIMELPLNRAIPLLSKYQKQCIFSYLYLQSTLFIIAKKLKQSTCPQTDEWVSKIRYATVFALQHYNKIHEITAL